MGRVDCHERNGDERVRSFHEEKRTIVRRDELKQLALSQGLDVCLRLVMEEEIGKGDWLAVPAACCMRCACLRTSNTSTL